VNTVFVSLLASARLHGIEPLAYLRDLLCLIPGWPRHRLLELAPADWKQTLELPETSSGATRCSGWEGVTLRAFAPTLPVP
jgi:transposase